MPLDGTSPNLDSLLISVAVAMELTERDLRVAHRRYNMVVPHLQRPVSPLARYMDDALVYAQGSRAIGATIVHGATDDRYDLDAVLEFARPYGLSPGRLLDLLVEAFAGFPDAKAIVRCTRCVQVRFAFMHLDVTPMDPAQDPRPERVGFIYHSPDHGGDETFDVNPYGFAVWFKSQLVMPQEAFIRAVRDVRASATLQDRFLAPDIMADATTENLPAVISPYRDYPQVIALKLMKRYLNLRYADRDMKRPVSVFLSKIAAEVPLSSFGLCAQLEDLTHALDQKIGLVLDHGKRLEERNPVYPNENFNDRWPRQTEELEVFRKDLQNLTLELRLARASDLEDIQKVFDRLFGERVTTTAISDFLRNAGPATSYERGKGVLAASGLLSAKPLATSTISSVRPHSFHSGRVKP